MVKQCLLCVKIKNHHITNLVKAPYGMHTKGNIAKIVWVDHLVQGVKLLNK